MRDLVEEHEELTNLRKKETDKRNFVWTNKMDEFLIDELTDQMHKGQKMGGTFTTSAYSTVVDEISKKIGVFCTSENVKNRLRTLKKNYGLAHDILVKDSGFGFNQSTQMIEAATDVWENLIKARPQASTLRFKPIRNYHKLDELLGKDRATGEFAAGPKERQLCWSKKNKVNNVEGSVSTEQFNQDDPSFEAGNEHDEPVQEASSNCKPSSTIPKETKKKKKEQINIQDEFQSFQETFKEGMHAVALALDRGNLRNYDESTLFKEVEKIDIRSVKAGMKVYQQLCEDPSSARAFLACPEDARALWVSVKFDSIFLNV